MLETIFIFMIGVISYTLIALAPYIDSVNVLLKIKKLFSDKQPRGYRDYQKVRQSVQYRNHIRTWMKRKLLLLGVYFILFIFINIAVKSAELAMIISFIATIIIMAIQSNKEHFELQKSQEEMI